jgi:hypothetical protein
MGLTEPNPVSPSPNPTPNPSPNPTIATHGQVCFFPYVNYQGTPKCTFFSYGNQYNKWQTITAKVGSVKVEPVNGNAPQLPTKITFFHYATEYSFGIGGVSKSNNVSDTSSLFQRDYWYKGGLPYIFGVLIQSP